MDGTAVSTLCFGRVPHTPPSDWHVSGAVHLRPTPVLVLQHVDEAMHLDPHATCPEGQAAQGARQPRMAGV